MDYKQHIPEHHFYCHHTNGIHTTYPRTPRLLSSHQRTTYNISSNTAFIVVTPTDYIQHILEHRVYCRHTNGLHPIYPRTPRLLSSHQWTTYSISPNTTFIVVTPTDYIQYIPEHRVYCRHTNGLHTTYPRTPRLLSSHQRTTYNISPNTTFNVVTPTDYIQHIPEHRVYCRHTNGLHTTYPRTPRLLSSHQWTTYNISPNTTFIVVTPTDYIQHIPEHHVYCRHTNGLHTTYPRTPRLLSSHQRTTYNISPNTTFIVVTPMDYIQHIPEHHVYCRHTNGLHTIYPRTPRLLSSHQRTTYNISLNTTFIVVTPTDYIQHIPEHHVYCRHTKGLHTTYPRTPRLLSSHQRTTYNISPNTTFIVVTPTDYIQHIPEHHVYCRHTNGLHTTYPRTPRLLSSHQWTTYNISPNTTFIVVTPTDYIQHIPEHHVYCRHTNGLHTTYPRTPRLLSSHQRTTYNISPNTTFIVVTPKDYIQHIPEHHVYCRHTKGLHTTYPRTPRLLSSHQRTTYNISPNTTFIVVTPKDYIQHIPEHHVYCRHTNGLHTTYPRTPRLLSSHQWTTYNISPNTTFIVITPMDYIQHIPEHHVYCRHTKVLHTTYPRTPRLLSSHQWTTYNISPNTTFIVVTPMDYIQHIPEHHVYCRHTNGLHTTYPRTPRLLSSHQWTTYNISPNTTFIVVTPKDYIQHIPEHHVYCRHTNGLHTTYPRTPRLLSSHQRTTYNISPNTTFIVVTPKDYIQHIPEHHVYCRHTKGLHTTYPRTPRLLSSHQRTTYNISPNTTFIVVTPTDYIQHIPEHHVYCRHTNGLHTTYPRTPRLLSSHQRTTYNISPNTTFIVVTPKDYIQHIPEYHVYCRHTNCRTTYNISPNTTFIVVTPKDYIQHIPEHHVYCRHTKGLLHTTYPRTPRLLSSHQPKDYIQHIPEHHVYCRHTNGLHTTYPRTPRLLSSHQRTLHTTYPRTPRLLSSHQRTTYNISPNTTFIVVTPTDYIQHIPEHHVYCRHTNGLHTTYPRTPRLLSSHQRTTYNISPNTTFIVVTPTDYIQHIPEHHVYCHDTKGLHTTYPRTPRLLS